MEELCISPFVEVAADQLKNHPRAPVHLAHFLTRLEAENLSKCLESSHDEDSNDLRTISGYQEQWKFSGTKKTIDNIKSRSFSVLSNAFEQNGEAFGSCRFSEVLGMRSTETTKPQFPHADMNHSHGFVVIVYLSRCKSAYFHDDMFQEKGIHLEELPKDSDELHEDYSFISLRWKRYYRQNFSAMLSLDSDPLAYRCFEVDAGDAVIFRSDSIHFGPGADPLVERRMIFFTMMRKISPDVEMKAYDSNDQLQPWTVAERLYGRDSENWRGVMRHYSQFHPHLHFDPIMELREAYGDEQDVRNLREQLLEAQEKLRRVTESAKEASEYYWNRNFFSTKQ